MDMRAELEAALARAEAGWHDANDNYGKAQANLVKASAALDELKHAQSKR